MTPSPIPSAADANAAGIVNLFVRTRFIAELERRKALKSKKRLEKSCDYKTCFASVTSPQT
jgi:hypothetical protein